MAFTGVHVVCSFVGDDARLDGGAPLVQADVWSAPFAANAPGTTPLAAPADRAGSSPIFSIDTSIDIYFAIGPNPNASASPQRVLRAGASFDRYVQPGDKLAWIVA